MRAYTGVSIHTRRVLKLIRTMPRKDSLWNNQKPMGATDGVQARVPAVIFIYFLFRHSVTRSGACCAAPPTLLAQDKDGVLVTDRRERTTVTALRIEIYGRGSLLSHHDNALVFPRSAEGKDTVAKSSPHRIWLLSCLFSIRTSYCT